MSWIQSNRHNASVYWTNTAHRVPQQQAFVASQQARTNRGEGLTYRGNRYNPSATKPYSLTASDLAALFFQALNSQGLSKNTDSKSQTRKVAGTTQPVRTKRSTGLTRTTSSDSASTNTAPGKLTTNRELQGHLSSLARDPGLATLMEDYAQAGARIQNKPLEGALGSLNFYPGSNNDSWIDIDLERIKEKWKNPDERSRDVVARHAKTEEQYIQMVIAHELYHTAQIKNSSDRQGNNSPQEEGLNTALAINTVRRIHGLPELSENDSITVGQQFASFYNDLGQTSKTNRAEYAEQVAALQAKGINPSSNLLSGLALVA